MNVAVEDPDGTTTLDGSEATAGSDDDNATVVLAVAAMSSVTVPVFVSPPVTVAADRLTALRSGSRWTFAVAVAVDV